jgi:ribose/xylose/arabinose/galactoside ABC-type transport system permease subunit
MEPFNVDRLRGRTHETTWETLANYYIWPLLIIVALGMAAIYPPLRNLGVANRVLVSAVDLIILSIAITFVLGAAEIDLSIVGTLGVAPLVAITLIGVGVPWFLSVLIIIPVVGVAVGLVNAWLVNTLEIDSLIATLGTYFVLIGILFAATEGSTEVAPQGYIIMDNTILGVELNLLALIIVVVSTHLILTRHPVGFDLLLTGGDADSARRAGVDIERVRRNAFVISAVLCGVAGFLLSSRGGTVSATFGQERLLPAIAAPILGGVLLSGGKAKIHQAVGGALLLQTIDTGLTIAGLGGYLVRFYTGFLILIAIIIGGLRTVRLK